MTLVKLLLYIGIIALVLTLLVGFLKKGHKSWVMTFLQNYTGVLFIISGWVKAIDPMGTAFKMEQYFAEFKTTFEETAFSFLAPVFPWLASHAIWFSVFMIILEIIVGIMLILGHRSRLTSWIFLIILAFFTFLTGFTYLTGFVPAGENFFSFSKWGAYEASNMRVTDCGCFGDFIKLDPRISFLKDVFLLIPAIIFVFRHKDMHQLFTPKARAIILGVATIALLVYCIRNFVWNEPHVDFRPFRIGVNVAAQKTAEEEAQANVEILTWKFKNKADGRIVELSNDTYMKDFKAYPKEEWDFVDHTKTEPAIPATKISDFKFVDADGNDMTPDILESEEPVLLIVSYKLKGSTTYVQEQAADSVYMMDTVRVGDSTAVVQRLDTVKSRMENKAYYNWDPRFVSLFTEKLHPLVEQAEASGMKVFGAAGAADANTITNFRQTAGAKYTILEADDIMLKTIMRSNPGLLLFKNGTILGKWHHRHLPTAQELKALAEK